MKYDREDVKNKVASFLREHPEIKPFLQAARPTLDKCFEKPVDIVLEVMSNTQLVGWIQNMDDVNEGLAKLDRFDKEWFLDHMAEVGNKFNFNIETR